MGKRLKDKVEKNGNNTNDLISQRIGKLFTNKYNLYYIYNEKLDKVSVEEIEFDSIFCFLGTGKTLGRRNHGKGSQLIHKFLFKEKIINIVFESVNFKVYFKQLSK